MMQQTIRHRAGPIYFLFAFAVYLIGGTYLEASGLVYLSILSLGVAFLTGLSKGVSARTSIVTPFFLVMLAFAAFNMLVTTDRGETSLRWALWLQALISFGLLATDCDEGVDLSLSSLLPFGTVAIWFAKYHLADSAALTEEAKEAELHLSAFFASMTVACGLFHPRPALRWLFCVIGVYGVLISGSRAAFIFLPVLFFVPAMYYSKSRASAIAAAMVPIALLAGLFFNDTFRDATFGRKAVYVGRDAIADAQSSMDDRGYLRQLAVDMIKDRPLGYGYGNTYAIPGVGTKSRGTNFHNGYLNVGAAMGAPFLVLYVCFNAWLALSLYSDGSVPRLFRHLFLSVLVCANLRAATEDFTLFDLGNPVCYLIIYMTFMYLAKRRYLPAAAAGQ